MAKFLKRDLDLLYSFRNILTTNLRSYTTSITYLGV